MYLMLVTLETELIVVIHRLSPWIVCIEVLKTKDYGENKMMVKVRVKKLLRQHQGMRH